MEVWSAIRNRFRKSVRRLNISSNVYSILKDTLRTTVWRFFGEGMPRRELRVRGSELSYRKEHILTNIMLWKTLARKVSFQDGRVLDAKVIGTDPQTDLC